MRRIKFTYKDEYPSFLKNLFNSMMDSLMKMDINVATKWDAQLLYDTAYEIMTYGEQKGEM